MDKRGTEGGFAMSRPGRENNRLAIAFDDCCVKHQEMMCAGSDTPVDAPFQGGKSMLDGIRCKGRLTIQRKKGLGAQTSASILEVLQSAHESR